MVGGRPRAARDRARSGRALARRGLLFVDTGLAEVAVVTGSAHVRIFAGAGGARGRRQLSAAVSALRRIGRPPARLPAPALPRTVLSKLRQAERAYRRAGSLDAAARALDVRPVLVRRRLQFARAVRSLPRVRAVGCRGR